MNRATRLLKSAGGMAVMSALIALGAWMLFAGEAERAGRRPSGYPQLISIEALPAMDGGMCLWAPASTSTLLVSALQQERGTVRSAAGSPASTELNRAPLRVIHDSYPTYSAVAVDTVRNEIILQDENLFNIMVFDRMDNTPSNAAMTEPKRVIGGDKTKMGFNCGLYVDPASGDIYSINNDTIDTMTVFSRSARGNVAPDRALHTPHRVFGIAVAEQTQELFLTVQHPPAVVVYRKMAQGDEAPLRILEGDNTQLEDAHGIAVDTKNNVMFVSNHGAVSRNKNGKNLSRGISAVAPGDTFPTWNIPSAREIESNTLPGSGRYELPSITVYPLDASGDTPPLRVIEGSRTRLNWPAQIYLDQERQELYVANDVDHSILVFRAADSGNVAPIRVLKGPQTGLRNPTDVFVDSKNDEIVVANMGNHSATVYPRTADGDVAPLRTIRSAPLGKVALAIGNPGAVAYDTKRDEILVPN